MTTGHLVEDSTDITVIIALMLVGRENYIHVGRDAEWQFFVF